MVTTTSKKYEDKFGFKQNEVIKALKEYGLEDKKEVGPYWANTNSNSLVGKLIREGNTQVKEFFELLLSGKEIVTELDEHFSKTGGDYNAFIKAMLVGDIESMNAYMNRISRCIFSYFNVGRKSTHMSEPERFLPWICAWTSGRINRSI